MKLKLFLPGMFFLWKRTRQRVPWKKERTRKRGMDVKKREGEKCSRVLLTSATQGRKKKKFQGSNGQSRVATEFAASGSASRHRPDDIILTRDFAKRQRVRHCEACSKFPQILRPPPSYVCLSGLEVWGNMSPDLTRHGILTRPRFERSSQMHRRQ